MKIKIFVPLLPGDTNVREEEIIKLAVNPANVHVFDSKGTAMKRREVPIV